MALVAGASPAGAANGDPVLLGDANSATGMTSISTTGAICLEAYSSQNGGLAVLGQCGGIGGIGVYGQDEGSTSTGYGVYGQSDYGNGVYGTVASKSGLNLGSAGVWGDSYNDIGVVGDKCPHRASSRYSLPPGQGRLSVPPPPGVSPQQCWVRHSLWSQYTAHTVTGL